MNRNVTQTTVTTQTNAQQVVQPVVAQPVATQNIVQKSAVVTNVLDKAVLGAVIERQNVEVVHKPVVQEIHEQKIIELERQNVMTNVQQGTVMQRSTEQTRYEEIGHSDIESERLRLAQLNAHSAPVVTRQAGSTQEVSHGEVVAQVIRQEHIERHVQPVITEVREQNIVKEVTHPVVRTVHEQTIVREVGGHSQPVLLQQQQQQQQVNVIGTTQGINANSNFSGDQRFLQYEQSLLSQHQQHGSSFNHTEWIRANPAPTGYVPTGLLASQGLSHYGTTITTSTSGGNVSSVGQQNFSQHEQKVLPGSSSLERQNLAVHEQAVNQVMHGGVTQGTTMGGAPIYGTGVPVTGTTLQGGQPIHGSTIHEDEQKSGGIMSKVKNALHLGGHNKQ